MTNYNEISERVLGTKRMILVRVFYVLIWVLGLVWGVLSEVGMVPVDYLPHDGETEYYVGLLAVVMALGGTFLSLRFMAFKCVRKRLKLTADRSSAEMLYLKFATMRLSIIAVAIWTNVVLYYATSYVTSTKYCLLITLIAVIFCWPSHQECDEICGTDGDRGNKPM